MLEMGFVMLPDGTWQPPAWTQKPNPNRQYHWMRDIGESQIGHNPNPFSRSADDNVIDQT